MGITDDDQEIEEIPKFRQQGIDVKRRRGQSRLSKSYIIDKIFPTGAMHIISGASASGKSTLLYQWLYEWDHGREVLGFRSFPCPWAMITFDRGIGDTDDTLIRLKLQDWNIPVWGFEELYNPNSTPDLLTICKDPRFKGVELFVVEGLASFIPDPKPKQSQNKCEQMWIAKIRAEILAKGKTIVGTMHQTKQQGSGQLSRNNMLGSASFIGGVSTVVIFDETADVRKAKALGKTVASDSRLVTICSRQMKDIQIQYERDANGKFVEFDDSVKGFVADPDDDEKLTHASNLNNAGQRAGEPDALKKMVSYLDSFKPGEELKTKDLLSKGYEIGWSIPTTNRWISDQIEKGKLTRLRQGFYGKGMGVN